MDKRNLNRIQFEHFADENLHGIEASDRGSYVGHLFWSPHGDANYKPGEITALSVDRPYQRRGVATEMYNRARVINPGVQIGDNRTRAGAAWARSVEGS